MKARRITNNDGSPYGFMIDCPGCGIAHIFDGRWKFEGTLESPTFTPSLHVRWPQDGKEQVCHSFVKDGRIQFLGDCTHALANTTVDLPDT